MAKRYSWMAVGLVVLVLGSTADSWAAGLRLEGIGGIGAGDTAYEISASDASTTIRSRLEFPLDGLYVGVDGSLVTGAGTPSFNNITVGLKFLTNISDPEEDMNDYDWINGFLVGDTASDAEASTMLIDFYLKGDLLANNSMTIRGVGGVRYESYDFEIYGLNGYYLPPIGAGPAFMSSDILVLTYEMTHSSVYGGLEGELSIGSSLVASGGATLGIGMVEDRDDHVLRDKISEGEFFSVYMTLSAYLTWYLAPPDAASRLFIKGGFETMAMTADGEQDQSFEDGTPGYNGIDDEIELSFVTGNAVVGCEF